MLPRGCLRPSPPSTECGGGRCALAAGRLPSGASLFGRVSMSGAVVQIPPPFCRYDGRGAVSKWDAARRLGGTPRAPGAGGAAIDRRARGCPSAISMHCRRGGRSSAISLFSRGVARDGCFLFLCLLVPYIPLANPFPGGRGGGQQHTACACCFLPLRTFGTDPCINNSAIPLPGRKRCSPAATDQP